MNVVSDDYRQTLEQYHNNQRRWGTNAGTMRIPLIQDIIAKHNAETILDYGAGKATLTRACRIAGMTETITPYEPGVPEYAELPEPHDVVVSFGVLEHVEPELIDQVLKHTHSLTKTVAYHEIGTLPSKHIMPDGRPAHLIVEKAPWWKRKLEQAGYEVVGVEPNFVPKTLTLNTGSIGSIAGDPYAKLDPTRGKGHVMFTCYPR